MAERIIVLCVGFILDIIIGDPYWLWHPVRGIGKVIELAEKILIKVFRLREGRETDSRKKIIAGGIMVITVIFVSVVVPFFILFFTEKINIYFRIVLECIMCYEMLAMKSLKTESMKVYNALKSGSVEKARIDVSMIVGRDTQKLSEEGIIKAAVETVAENTSDGVIAPLIYMMLFGPLGGFFYKAVNTMDSMVGYKNDRYYYFGKVAAKLDDILNYIPSRISALFMIIVAFILKMDYKNAIYIYKRDRYNHASPNSAQTEAVCAGALSVQLAGDAYYFGQLYKKPTIGDYKRSVEAEDIKRANYLLYGTSFITLLFGVLLMIIILIMRV